MDEAKIGQREKEVTPFEHELDLQEKSLVELKDAIERLSNRLFSVRQDVGMDVDKLEEPKSVVDRGEKIINRITDSVNKSRQLKERVEQIISELVV